MTFFYLKPEPTFKTGITMVLVIILITVLAINYIHIYLNWNIDSVKCRVDNLYLAYITNNMKDWNKKCVINKKT
jgi:hypothetical protein